MVFVAKKKRLIFEAGKEVVFVAKKKRLIFESKEEGI